MAGATQKVKSDTLETKCLEEILILDKYTSNQHEETRNQNHRAHLVDAECVLQAPGHKHSPRAVKRKLTGITKRGHAGKALGKPH